MTTPELFSQVRVVWNDIVTTDGWYDSDKIAGLDKPHVAHTLGFLTYVDKDYLVISHTRSINGPDQYNGHISIPIGCIESIENY